MAAIQKRIGRIEEMMKSAGLIYNGEPWLVVVVHSYDVRIEAYSGWSSNAPNATGIYATADEALDALEDALERAPSDRSLAATLGSELVSVPVAALHSDSGVITGRE